MLGRGSWYVWPSHSGERVTVAGCLERGKDSGRRASGAPARAGSYDPQLSCFTSASTPSRSLNLIDFGLADTGGRVISETGPFTFTR